MLSYQPAFSWIASTLAWSSRQRTTIVPKCKVLLCRIQTNDWLNKHGQSELNLNNEELSLLDDILRVPVYPMKEADDYGSFGNNISIAGLVANIKTTVVMWNLLTLTDVTARQPVIEFTRNADGTETIAEYCWDSQTILRYSQANECIHIEWNGVDHYSALVPPSAVVIDPSFHQQLVSAGPVTRKRHRSLSNNWVAMKNCIRSDPLSSQVTTWPVDTETSILKEDCLRQNHNAIVIMDDMVRFATFDFYISPSDCAKAGDFECSFMVKNVKKAKTAPLIHCMSTTKSNAELFSARNASGGATGTV
jgi:hypothetical protein